MSTTIAQTHPLVVIFDLRDPGAQTKARRCRALWGRRFSDITVLDNDHVALTFRPSPNRERWETWEWGRMAWVLRELEAA